MATNFVKKWQTPLIRRSSIQKRNGISLYLNVCIKSVNDASISCKHFVDFGPVTPELTELICELWYMYDMAKKLAYLVEYLSIYYSDFCHHFTV